MKIEYHIEDFIDVCVEKGLSRKTYGSYEQALRLFARYLEEEKTADEDNSNSSPSNSGNTTGNTSGIASIIPVNIVIIFSLDMIIPFPGKAPVFYDSNFAFIILQKRFQKLFSSSGKMTEKQSDLRSKKRIFTPLVLAVGYAIISFI